MSEREGRQCGRWSDETGAPDFFYQPWQCGRLCGHDGMCGKYAHADELDVILAARQVSQ